MNNQAAVKVIYCSEGPRPKAGRTMKAPTLKEEALKHHQQGFNVFPIWEHDNGICLCGSEDCGNAGKHPLDKWGRYQHRKQTREEVVMLFNEEEKIGGIGAPTGSINGVFVLDTDVKAGRNGEQTIKEANLALPKTLTVRTGSGGLHRYFKIPEGKTIKNGNNLYPGVDIRGEGGYVVLPPSRHKNGEPYRVEVNADIAEAPEELLNWLKASPRGESKLEQFTGEAGGREGLISYGKPIPSGERNDTLQKMAVKFAAMVHEGKIKEEEYRAIMHALGDSPGVVQEPFDTGEHNKLERTITGALSYIGEKQAPRQFTLVNGKELNAQDHSRDYIIGTDNAGILAPGFLIWVLGPPKTGKSLLALDMAMAIADKKSSDWCEFPVGMHSRVLFLSAEGGPKLLQDRQNKREQNPEDIIYWWPQNGQKIDVAERPQDLVQMIKDAKAEVVFLDPLVKFHSLDENSTKDMALLMKRLQEIRLETGAAIVMVHHTRKKGQNSKAGSAMEARGSSVIWGEVDSTLVLEKASNHKNKLNLDFELRWSEAPAMHVLGRNPDLRFLVLDIVERGDGREKLPVEAIYELLEANPGRWFSKRDIVNEIDAEVTKNAITAEKMDKLVKEGRVEFRTFKNNTHQWRFGQKEG